MSTSPSDPPREPGGRYLVTAERHVANAGRHLVNATADDALASSDLTELIARMARREVSAEELRAAALTRARGANPELNALARWFDGPIPAPPIDDDAPLAGIPTFIKDNEEVVGYPTSQGSRAVPDRPAPASSPIVATLLAMGLQPLGATTLPEFGLTASTESSRYGATRNPWDTSRSAGGSSGGSAAMVAAGVVPIAHANDGGGSIRIPAACCGLVGLKSTRGRLPANPIKERLPIRIAHQGVLTRTVRDTALFHAALERTYLPRELPPIGAVRQPSTRRLRIGLCDTAIRGLPLEPETVAAVRRAGELCADLGHHVEHAPAPVGDDFAADFLRYWALVAFALHRRGGAVYGPGFDGDRVEELTKGLSGMLVRQVERLPSSLLRLRRLVREPDTGFGTYDVLLTPVTGYPAPPIGYLGPDVAFRTNLVRLLQFAVATPVQNVSGGPAMSLPLGRTGDGRPIGVQLAGRFGQDRTLLELGLELEQAAPWPTLPTA